MEHGGLLELTLIAVAGISAQWLGWRFRVPSILPLIAAGLALGPLSGVLNPDALFGHILPSLVSLAVAVILFEGGLNLKLNELREVGGELVALCTLGAAITWGSVSVLAHYLLGFDWPLAILLGAVLVVTGPTVVMPLLRHIRLRGRSGSLLKWEGILIDPIGATLAVLVFEGIANFPNGGILTDSLFAIFITIVTGGVLGFLGGVFTVALLRFFWVPGYLRNAVVLMMVLAIFTASNLIQAESGLLTVTLFGIFLANQKSVSIRSIVGFKEDLQVLLLSLVFITLAARLSMEDILSFDSSALLFVLLLIFFVRPVSVFASTLRSSLSWQEKSFLAALAPRGIVAAAISSIFAEQLSRTGMPGTEAVVPITFFVIIGTVLFYSLFSPALANLLGLSNKDPNGMLIVGAQSWILEIAEVLKAAGAEVELVDTNWFHVTRARQRGFQCHYGSVLSDELHESLEMTQYGSLLAMTQNDEANSLAAESFGHVLGYENVYQLTPQVSKGNAVNDSTSKENLKGRLLFSTEVTYPKLQQLFRAGYEAKATKLTKEFSFEDFKKKHSSSAPLFVVRPDGKIAPLIAGGPRNLEAENVVIALVPGSETPEL